MLIDAQLVEHLPVPADPVLVVGSGPAGLALALDLVRRGKRVVLLESGPDPRARRGGTTGLSTKNLNEGSVIGLPFQLQGRARELGGTTALWHGQCMRLHPLDLEQRPWVPFSGWPLTLEELDRYYPEAERWMGVAGGDYGPGRWSTHPRLVPFEWDSSHLLHDFTEYAPVPQLLKRYGKDLGGSPLLLTVVNATVARVVMRGDAVAGVDVVTAGHSHRVAAHQVVLAAGAIENARILQLSDEEGVGLGTGRRHTGRFLQTHPVVNTALVHARDAQAFTDRYVLLRRGSQRVFPKVRLAPAAQREHQLMDATAVFMPTYDDEAFLAAQRLWHALRDRRRPENAFHDTVRTSRYARSLARDLYRRYARGMATAARPSSIALQLWLEQQPDAESRLDLDEKRDELGLRRARVNWNLGEPERRTSRMMTEWIGADLARLGLARLETLPSMEDDASWTASVRDAAHPSGTTRMSTDPRQGVVDADLEVHGVQGLYVLGSSVFPVAGYANPTLTIVALAFRLSQHLTSTARAR